MSKFDEQNKTQARRYVGKGALFQDDAGDQFILICPDDATLVKFAAQLKETVDVTKTMKLSVWPAI